MSAGDRSNQLVIQAHRESWLGLMGALIAAAERIDARWLHLIPESSAWSVLQIVAAIGFVVGTYFALTALIIAIPNRFGGWILVRSSIALGFSSLVAGLYFGKI